MQRASDRTQAAIILLAVNIIVALGLACYALDQHARLRASQAGHADRLASIEAAVAQFAADQKDLARHVDFLSSCQQETSVYGQCPKCGGAIVARERRIAGNDTCEHGHVFPSAEAVLDGAR